MLLGIIQARMGSKRFPGKVMANLGNYRVIDWVLSRIQRSELLRSVVLAIPDTPENNELASLAQHSPYYIDVVRGPEEDVLTRFVKAAKKFKADHIVRICADNPFIDPDEIDRLIGWYFYNRPDYARNHPDFGAEIFSMEKLLDLDRISVGINREHVTACVGSSGPHEPLKDIETNMRFDVNTPNDLKRLNMLIPPVTLDFSAREIIEAAKRVW